MVHNYDVIMRGPDWCILGGVMCACDKEGAVEWIMDPITGGQCVTCD